MDRDLFRSLVELEIMNGSSIGLEKFSHVVKLQDLWSHYTKRFLKNITTVFEDFSQSEIQHYLSKYNRQLSLTLTDPLLRLEGTIVSIPKGMQKSYLETLSALDTVLESVQAATLLVDLTHLIETIEKAWVPPMRAVTYDQARFYTDTKILGALYVKNGIPFADGEHVLHDGKSTSVLCTQLLKTVSYYSDVIKLNKLTKSLEHSKNTATLTDEQETYVKEQLLSIAYRISVFAMVMIHIQEMEHALVKTLDILRTTHDRR